MSNDPTGALVHIDFNLPHNGTVVVSQYSYTASSAQIIFTTVRTPLDAIHPITGNRVFGVMPDPNNPGGFIFYTTAVDRVSEGLWAFFNDVGEYVPIVPSGFENGDDLWRSMQTKMAQFISNNSGMAGPYISNNFPNGELIHRPEWIMWDLFLRGAITYEQMKAYYGC